MASTDLHFRLGENIGEILLGIAQDNIENCQFEKAISTYVDSFQGFSKEYAMDIIKGKLALTTTEDGMSVIISDDPKYINDVKDHLYDWTRIVNNLVEDVETAKKRIIEIKNSAMMQTSADVNNYDLSVQEKVHSGLNNIVARYIAGDDISVGKFPIFYRMLDRGDYDINSLDRIEKIYYYIVHYVDAIKYLHKDIVKLDKLYNFLLENEFIERVPFIEHIFERICDAIFREFCDTTTGYNHPLCDDKIFELKDTIFNDIKNTKYGNEYFENGIVRKNILDGYDAGYLAPDGTFYGLNGSDQELLHVQLSDMLTETVYAELNTANSFDKEYELMNRGFMKIHHDTVYGHYAFDKSDKTARLYCPTKTQIDLIYKYANKFYGGKINTNSTGYDEVSVSALRQMDEIALRNVWRY